MKSAQNYWLTYCRLSYNTPESKRNGDGSDCVRGEEEKPGTYRNSKE
jgi:hypothetical protein